MNNTFEIPYNFDLNLINFLKILDPDGETISCIYIPPFVKDYQTILRGPEQAEELNSMTREEYENHIQIIQENFPGKMQLLLQKLDIIMNEDQIIYYQNLGFNNFCVANLEQAKIIKKINSNNIIVGSIAMNITLNDLVNNIQFKSYFDYFVLPFNFCKDLEQIKILPKNYKYILLVNAYCNSQCKGTHHWNFLYKKEDKEIYCPGILYKNNLKWENTTRIRPMDLNIFIPYIHVFKLQDRGWPTAEIIRDYILYTSDYSIYPEINYTEKIYKKKRV